MTQPTEHLVAAAIIRDGVVESRGFKTHSHIRAALGDNDPYSKRRGDDEGFLTNTGRFVNRHEARVIGSAVGQCGRSPRELLSADILW